MADNLTTSTGNPIQHKDCQFFQRETAGSDVNFPLSITLPEEIDGDMLK
jgi:hypothetical protein